MQPYIKLNNDILNCGLSVNELKVAVYLYGCVFQNRPIVCVKQSTIAEKCGFKTISAVADMLCRLRQKGVIEGVSRPHKRNGQLGTYVYKLKPIVKKGYFKVKKYTLNQLSAVELRVYLFICRAVKKDGEMWNSFTDISKALKIGREKVVLVIKQLISKGLITKRKVLKKDGSYSDNHYSLTEAEAVPESKLTPKRSVKKQEPKIRPYINNRVIFVPCQEGFCPFSKKFVIFSRGAFL